MALNFHVYKMGLYELWVIVTPKIDGVVFCRAHPVWLYVFGMHITPKRTAFHYL